MGIKCDIVRAIHFGALGGDWERNVSEMGVALNGIAKQKEKKMFSLAIYVDWYLAFD